VIRIKIIARLIHRLGKVIKRHFLLGEKPYQRLIEILLFRQPVVELRQQLHLNYDNAHAALPSERQDCIKLIEIS
jgi:hypothetical protein